MDTSHLLFVSHSHEDDLFCQRLIADLRANLGGEAVWYDISGGLHGGDDWWNRIIAEITERPYFLVVLSPHASSSKWVPEEMSIAFRQKVELGKRLLPIRLAESPRREDWKGIQEFDFTQVGDPARYADALAEVLRAIDPKLSVSIINTPPTASTPAEPERPLSPNERIAQEVHAAYAREHWSDVFDKTTILVERGAMTPALWRERVSAAFSFGDSNSGLAVIAQALKAGVDDADTLLLYTRLAVKASNNEQTAKILTDVYALVSLNDTATRVAVLDELIAALAHLKRWDEFTRRVSDARRLEPDNPRWLLCEIERLLGTRQFDEAIAEAQVLPANVNATSLLPAWHAAIATTADGMWTAGSMNGVTRRKLLDAASSIGVDTATVTRWRRFDFAHFASLHTLVHDAFVSDVTWSPDGTLLAAVSCDRTATVWNVFAARKVVVLRHSGGELGAAAWAPNVNQLAIASGSTVHIYDATNWQQVAKLSTIAHHVRNVLGNFGDGNGVRLEHVAWSPNGAYLATASSDGRIQVWDVVSERLLASFSGDTPRRPWLRSRQCAVAWSSDSAQLAALVNSPREVMVWNAITGNLVTEISLPPGDDSEIWAVAWSSDGACLITDTLHTWDASSGRLLADSKALRFHSSSCAVYGHPHMNRVAWAPDGIRMATGKGYNVSSVRVLDVATGRDIDGLYDPITLTSSRSDREPYPQLRAVAWAPDDTRLAIATDARVIIWKEE